MNRIERMRRMREKGMSYEEIGDVEGISRQRVHHILKPETIARPRQRAALLVDTGTAAEMLGLHVNTVRRWDREGVLQSIRIGVRGDRRFKRTDIEKLRGHYEH